METLAVNAARKCAVRSSSNLAPSYTCCWKIFIALLLLCQSTFGTWAWQEGEPVCENRVCVCVEGRCPVCVSERKKALGLIQLDPTSSHQCGISYLPHLKMCYFLKFCQKAWHGPRGVILVEVADAYWGLTLHSDYRQHLNSSILI